MKLRTRVALVAMALTGLYLLELIPERTIMKDTLETLKGARGAVISTPALASTPVVEKTIVRLNERSGSTGLNDSSIKLPQSSPLNDQSIYWDESIPRPWLDNTVAAKEPPGMILLTSYGWNQPNQAVAVKQYRSSRSTELLDGIVNHQWFHPTAWVDINSGRMEVSNTTRYYVFLDSETCGEESYISKDNETTANGDSKYGQENMWKNYDLHFEEVQASKVLQAPHAKYVLFDCGGLSPNTFLSEQRKLFKPKEKLALISEYTTRQIARPGDQGLPPPPGQTCTLSEMEDNDVKTCNEKARSILVSFSGTLRSSTGKALHELGMLETDVFIDETGDLTARINATDKGYDRLARQSSFSAVSRDENMSLYRFSEVMGCGAIPVVYADDWLLPFGADLINWADAAIVIRENETINTKAILSQISPSRRCRLRQKVLKIYRKYIETGRGTISGIIKNFELEGKSEEKAMQLQQADVRPQSIHESLESAYVGSNTNTTQTSPLNDQTVVWDTTVGRPWLNSSVANPKAMLLLTTFGWNHPNQTFGISQYRNFRTSELLDGIVNHPWFHPTAWDDINTGVMEISNDTRYYVFLDSETCGEKNYPRYGHGPMANRDTFGGRGVIGINWRKYDLHWKEVMSSKVLRAPLAKYILFDCCGWGPLRLMVDARKKFLPKDKLALISVSNTRQDAYKEDQGLPPPACRKFTLSAMEENDIKTCNEEARPILISFSGSVQRSQTRIDLNELGKGEDDIVVGGGSEIFARMNTTDAGEAFSRLAKQSLFAAASRGDNRFSYRFSEVLGCGAIPVVYADDWLLPFGDALLNWTDAAVVIQENETMNTKIILSQISPRQRCRMRQKALAVYRKYIETGRGTINGIIENFELSVASSPL